jgi:hypothetical protein
LEKYQILIDGKQVYDSGETGLAIIKVDIPADASLLELIIDQGENNIFDHSYWCYPKFHSVTAEHVTDRMLDEKTPTLKFNIAAGTAEFGVSRNQPIKGFKSVPIHFRDAVPCDEFLFAHAPSTVTYLVPKGMTRFSAIGVNAMSHSVKFEVWADAKRIYQSPQMGIIPIDVKLPPGTKTIELKIADLGDGRYDHSIWCYPRLSRK